jgi:hypothetical protein
MTKLNDYIYVDFKSAPVRRVIRSIWKQDGRRWANKSVSLKEFARLTLENGSIGCCEARIWLQNKRA